MRKNVAVKTHLVTMTVTLVLLARPLNSQLMSVAAVGDDSWENLNHVTHNRNYILMDDAGNCAIGEIKGITAQNLLVREFGAGARTVTFGRSNLLRVEDGAKATDVIFSGRSSWLDVKSLGRIGSDEAIVVTTKDGQRHRGKPVDISEAKIRLARRNMPVEVPKERISTVDYLREKPMSRSTTYAAQEAAFFDPTLWPYLLHIPPKLSVRAGTNRAPQSV